MRTQESIGTKREICELDCNTYRVRFVAELLKVGSSPLLELLTIPRVLDPLESPLDLSIQRQYSCAGEELVFLWKERDMLVLVIRSRKVKESPEISSSAYLLIPRSSFWGVVMAAGE